MADKLAAVAQQIAGDLVNTVAEQANTAVKDATESVSKDKAQSMGDIIANHTCDILNAKVPNIVSSVTNQILVELREKINSEQFTTDFVNVLQTKLLQDKTYSEPFLAKFDNLFDMIIKEAKDRHDRKEFEEPSQQGAGSHKKTKKKSNPKRKKTRRVRFL